MSNEKPKSENPKIEHVFSEMELIGREFNLRFRDDDDDDDGPTTVVIDPDPGVTETITCTEMVCSSSSFKVPISEFQTQFVLGESARFAETTTIRMRKSSRKR